MSQFAALLYVVLFVAVVFVAPAWGALAWLRTRPRDEVDLLADRTRRNRTHAATERNRR